MDPSKNNLFEGDFSVRAGSSSTATPAPASSATPKTDAFQSFSSAPTAGTPLSAPAPSASTTITTSASTPTAPVLIAPTSTAPASAVPTSSISSPANFSARTNIGTAPNPFGLSGNSTNNPIVSSGNNPFKTSASPLGNSAIGTNPLGTNSLGTNSFGTNPPGTNSLGTNPFGKTASDIVLPATGNPPRSKKPLIIAAVITLILILTAGLTFALLTLTSSRATANFKTAFNPFANYVISGTESGADIKAAYSATSNYFFTTSQTDAEAATATFAKTGELLAKAITSYNEHKNNLGSNKDTLGESLEKARELIEFMKIVYVKEPLSGSTFETMYKESGRDTALKSAENYYNFSGLNDNDYASDFSATYKYWLNLEVTYFDFFAETNCFENGLADSQCLLENNSAEAQENFNETLSELNNAYANLVSFYQLSPVFVHNVFFANEAINTNENLTSENSSEN